MMDLLFGDNMGWFTAPAIIGSLFFLLRLTLMLVGGHLGDADAHADVDVHADVGDVGGGHAGDAIDQADHPDSGDAFKLLSVQAIAAFLMGFGWGGLGAYRGTDWGWPVAVIVAIVCGVGMVWILSLLLKAVYDLQSSGNISINSAVGHDGSVYVTVPASGKGRGRVRVVIGNRQRVYNAITEGEELTRNSQVRVVRVNEDNTLTVAAI